MIESISNTRDGERNSIAGFPVAVIGHTINNRKSSSSSCSRMLRLNDLKRNYKPEESVHFYALSIFQDYALSIFQDKTECARDHLTSWIKGKCLEQRIENRHIKLFSYTEVEFDIIKRLYNLINESELRQYLTFNSFLYSTLINGSEVIKKRMGNEVFSSLELYTFIDGGCKSIFLSIHTDDELDDMEDDIVKEILSHSSEQLDGKIVISFCKK